MGFLGGWASFYGRVTPVGRIPRNAPTSKVDKIDFAGVHEAVRGVVTIAARPAAAERKWNNSKAFKDIYLKAKARIWL